MRFLDKLADSKVRAKPSRPRPSAKRQNGAPLTEIQRAIVTDLRDGLTYEQIALKNDRSASTVRTHLHKLYEKLGVADRAQAVLMCERNGWLPPGPNGAVAAVGHRLEDLSPEELRTVYRMRTEDEMPERPRPYLAEPLRGEDGRRPHEGVLADVLIASHLKGVRGTEEEFEQTVAAVRDAADDKTRRDMLVKLSAVAQDWAARIDWRRLR